MNRNTIPGRRAEYASTLIPKPRGDGRAVHDATRGTLVGRINSGSGIVEVRSPLPGRIEGVASVVGSNVNPENTLLTIISDEDSVWEVLRGLALVGRPEDLPLIEGYAHAATQPGRIRQQAAATADAIKRRSSQN